MQKASAILAATVTVLALGTGVWFAVGPGGGDERFAGCGTASVAGGKPLGGDFTLTAPDGSRMSRAEVIDRPALVYFGYTFCPDICPADAARNAAAVSLLAERGLDVRSVFVTIDPERDTPEQLGEFAEYFGVPMTALTGSPEELAQVRKDYLVYAAKAGEDDFYLMDHSTFTYLELPGEGVLDILRHEASPEEVADKVACYAAAAG
ncbi:SCO family protein [Paroceanicella profunda]|uniref:SCO family protein n=1 Tax=Paroceanicella profunda TaxID=2579971 RepID=A0A5B8FX63_9RHOB|nr:SCO family protein [Paroceanicella profunda]QDL91780.1 SCO family protein [Paroceanicella profunda]